MKTIIENLEWRYATKVFNTSKELTTADIDFVLQAGNLAATSYGLQPFSFVVVENTNKKQELIEHAYGQQQVCHNGALIVLAVHTDIDANYITEYTNRIEKIRNLPLGSASGYKDLMIGDLTNRTPEARLSWSQKQAYIALGTMMAAASEREIDNAGLEGFDSAKFNELLGLDALQLNASVLLVLGYRAETDATQHYAKVRKNIKDIVVRI